MGVAGQQRARATPGPALQRAEVAALAAGDHVGVHLQHHRQPRVLVERGLEHAREAGRRRPGRSRSTRRPRSGRPPARTARRQRRRCSRAWLYLESRAAAPRRGQRRARAARCAASCGARISCSSRDGAVGVVVDAESSTTTDSGGSRWPRPTERRKPSSICQHRQRRARRQSRLRGLRARLAAPGQHGAQLRVGVAHQPVIVEQRGQRRHARQPRRDQSQRRPRVCSHDAPSRTQRPPSISALTRWKISAWPASLGCTPSPES